MLQGDVCKLALSQERVRFWVQGQEAVLDEAAALALCVSPEGSIRIEAIGQEAADLTESDRPRLARGKDPEPPRRFVQDPAWLVAFSVVSQEPPNPRLIGSALLLSATIAMTWVLRAREWLRS